MHAPTSANRAYLIDDLLKTASVQPCKVNELSKVMVPKFILFMQSTLKIIKITIQNQLFKKYIPTKRNNQNTISSSFYSLERIT